MPVTSGIIDDYQTVAVRKARSEAAALRRVTALIIHEQNARPAEPLPVIPYEQPQPATRTEEQAAARLRERVHAIVDRLLGLK